MFDVLVQKWSPAWGMGRFLPIMLGLVLVYSVAFVPFFRKPLWNITQGGWPWLLGGAFFIALQGLVLISALAVIGDATAINIIYSSRGLWSVVAVWWVGHWFGNTEQEVGGGVLRWRLAGALLMMGAIALVLI